ncbi:copper resistance CopC family protein [Psychrobacillus vulpis]|uniref:CopC domain-containing protein n=1 Tax=Psychrobacillus vulpis TaxID=2325572 RepID=A0A544TRK1_9BACI|nr:copper resistance protein CopC [Psychrobacillus vulpis]TQR20071.1 hypothetical protein FG384_09245 [Psychrobacillus vulpis]
MKKIILIAFVFMLSFANSAFAHTGLESSSPANGEVIKEELSEITLTFEGKIEQSSTFELKNSNGESIPVENISINEGQMVGALSNPLENGNYEVVWSIIGADGHPIEGNIPFTVEVAAAETPVEDKVVEEENTVETPVTEQAKQAEEVQSSTNIVPIIVIALIAIIVGVFFWLRRKK